MAKATDASTAPAAAPAAATAAATAAAKTYDNAIFLNTEEGTTEDEEILILLQPVVQAVKLGNQDDAFVALKNALAERERKRKSQQAYENGADMESPSFKRQRLSSETNSQGAGTPPTNRPPALRTTLAISPQNDSRGQNKSKLSGFAEATPLKYNVVTPEFSNSKNPAPRNFGIPSLRENRFPPTMLAFSTEGNTTGNSLHLAAGVPPRANDNAADEIDMEMAPRVPDGDNTQRGGDNVTGGKNDFASVRVDDRIRQIPSHVNDQDTIEDNNQFPTGDDTEQKNDEARHQLILHGDHLSSRPALSTAPTSFAASKPPSPFTVHESAARALSPMKAVKTPPVVEIETEDAPTAGETEKEDAPTAGETEQEEATTAAAETEKEVAPMAAAVAAPVETETEEAPTAAAVPAADDSRVPDDVKNNDEEDEEPRSSDEDEDINEEDSDSWRSPVPSDEDDNDNEEEEDEDVITNVDIRNGLYVLQGVVGNEKPNLPSELNYQELVKNDNNHDYVLSVLAKLQLLKRVRLVTDTATGDTFVSPGRLFSEEPSDDEINDLNIGRVLRFGRDDGEPVDGDVDGMNNDDTVDGSVEGNAEANSDGGSTVYGNDSDDDTVAGSQAQNLDVEKDDTDADAKKDDKADSDGDSTVYGNDSDDDTVAGSHAQNLAVEKDGADADAKKDDKADSDGGSTVYGNDSDDDTAAGSHAQDLLVEKDDADAKKDDNDDDDDDDDDAPVEDDTQDRVPRVVIDKIVNKPYMIQAVETFQREVTRAKELVAAEPHKPRSKRARKAQKLLDNEGAEKEKILEETKNQAWYTDPTTWVEATQTSKKFYTVTYWCEKEKKKQRLKKELVKKHSRVFPGQDATFLDVHNFNVNHLEATKDTAKNIWTLSFKDFDITKSMEFDNPSKDEFAKANSIKTWANMDKLATGIIKRRDLWVNFPAVTMSMGTYNAKDDSILFEFRVAGPLCTYRMPRCLALKEMNGIPKSLITEMKANPDKAIKIPPGSLVDELNNNVIYEPDLDESNPKHPFPSPHGSWLCLLASVCTAMHLLGLEDEAKHVYHLLKDRPATKLDITSIKNGVNPYLWKNGIKYQLRNCKTTLKGKYFSNSYADEPAKWQNFPVIGTVRRGNGDSVNHCVCFYNDLVFDDSVKTALTLSNKVNQSYICQSSKLGTNLSKGWCIVQVEEP